MTTVKQYDKKEYFKSKEMIKGIECSLEVYTALIDAGTATDLLSRTVGNRRERKAHMERLTTAMTNDQWSILYDPIKISNNKSLIDGHHRLEAIVRTGIPGKHLIVEGLPTVSMEDMDQGVPRTITDNFGLSGYSYPSYLAAAIKVYWSLTRGDGFAVRRNPSNQQAKDIAERNPLLSLSPHDSIRFGNEMQKEYATPRPLVTTFHYIATMAYPKQAKEFFHSLLFKDPEVMKKTRDPRRKLISMINQHKVSAIRSGNDKTGAVWKQNELGSWFYDTFMAYVEGKSLPKFRDEEEILLLPEQMKELVKKVEEETGDDYSS